MVDVLEEPFELGAALCPVALGLVARFEQQGVLTIEPIEARAFWPSGCTSVSVAQRGQMFSGSRWASGW